MWGKEIFKNFYEIEITRKKKRDLTQIDIGDPKGSGLELIHLKKDWFCIGPHGGRFLSGRDFDKQRTRFYKILSKYL